jgi:hypothetical protein
MRYDYTKHHQNRFFQFRCLALGMRQLPAFFLILCLSFPVIAQRGQTPTLPDSVVITGQIRHLTARLYRQSPQITVSRNNILQPDRELARTAPLGVDGSFRVVLPLIYPQEELYFSFNQVSTAFLAAPGTITIQLDADSLFVAAVPFRFGGANAQVNQQFARFQAFEATQDKPTGKQLTRQTQDKTDQAAFVFLADAYRKPLSMFARRETVFPLVQRWADSRIRYNAAAFLYDKARFENHDLAEALTDSLRPTNDPILTAARAVAMGQFGEYVVQRIGAAEAIPGKTTGLTIRTMATILDRYTPNLTDAEQNRLRGFTATNTARNADLRFFQQLVARNPDTLNRITSYANLIQQAAANYDSLAVQYVTGYWLAKSLPSLTLDFAGLLYGYSRPLVREKRLGQSLDELYAIETKDSTRIRKALARLPTSGRPANAVELTEGVFYTQKITADGADLFENVLVSLRGRVVYVVLYDPTDAANRQAALEAQRIANAFRAKDVALLYLSTAETTAPAFREFAVKHSLTGDHLFLTADQWDTVQPKLRPAAYPSAFIIDRMGKINTRNAPLPDKFDEVRALIQKLL